jgi:hypothetical protein
VHSPSIEQRTEDPLTETSPRGAREVRRWRTVYDSAGTWGVSHLVRGSVASRWWQSRLLRCSLYPFEMALRFRPFRPSEISPV